VPGIADLPKARGALISKFLSEPSYTHILFVDADIEVRSPPAIRTSGRASVLYPIGCSQGSLTI
jgi:hypothetical protein